MSQFAWGTFAWGTVPCTGTIEAVELVTVPTVTQAAVNQAQIIGVNAITSTPTIEQASINTFQTIGVSGALSCSATVSQGSVAQGHAIVGIALTSTPTVTQASVALAHSILSVDLTLAPALVQASVSQYQAIYAYPLFSTPDLVVRNENYLGYSYSPENKSITNYSNFNFKGSCFFNGKTLLFNENGVYEYGGESDNGMAIVASIKTGKMNGIMGKGGVYPSNKIKRIPDAKVNIDCDKVGGQVTVNVTADENAAYSYNNAIVHTGFATHRVPIGRGITFNYVQFEIVGTGCDRLDIGSIEYNPVENVRRER